MFNVILKKLKMRTKITTQAKSLICFIFIFSFSTILYGQKKIMVNKGKINFFSNAPLEVIKASSDQMKVVIDPATNQFAFSVPIVSFKGFNSGLQREHFNEKYMESDKYPNASFSGKIIEKIDFFTDGIYEVRAKGDLEIHGQKQTRIIKSKITVKNSIISIETDFIIPLSDYNISVPNIISEKIASEIDVSVYASVSQKE
jgi:hypothetical protein